VNIIGATKGQGSVLQGIQFVQAQKISITKRSVHGIRAYRNYFWLKDKNDNTILVPDDTVHEWSNSMDAIRYGINLNYSREDVKQDLNIYNQFYD
jgi:phage terminase large subunit